MVWRQWCLAVGTLAWHGLLGVILGGIGPILRAWRALPFRYALSAVVVVGRMVWRQWCRAVGTLARFRHGDPSYFILFRWKMPIS
jgi:hypothetical protein